NWRKRNAEVLCLAADDSDSSDADGLLRAQFSEDETASLSPSADGNISYYDSDALVLSSDSDSEVAGSLSDDSAEETPPDLGEEVAAWAATNKCKRSALNELLDILRRQGHRLPKDARTLLKTPKRVETVELCGGQYAYFGIASGILKVLAQSPGFLEDRIDMCFNIDGIPLFKSSSLQMWPILCSFHAFAPFIVALYCGKAKPSPVQDYLSDFLQELQHLKEDGIVHGEKTLQVTVKAFICDAPARSFLKCIKNHNSYFACERCTVRGTYVGRVVLGATAPGVVARSEAEFSRLAYKDHQVEKSPLTLAGIPCIRTFALDYMHLVCLGVVRRMLHYMQGGPNTCRLSFQQRSDISDKLKALNGELPSEFARQPRTLLELDRWKATELRQFLLYTGPVVLRRVVSPAVYSHFLSLMVAMSILLNSDDAEREEHLDYVRELLMYYVRKCEDIYGNTFTVYNVHSLLHLPDDVEHFRCSLNGISGFPFENYLQTLKKMVRQSRNPIAQVAKRLAELEQSTKCRPLTKERFTRVSTRPRDCCFILQNKDYVFVKEIREEGTLVCDVLRQCHTESFFSEPCDSKLLNIVRVRDINRTKRRLISKQQLIRKVVCLPNNPGEADTG
ncbi:hypothetical protein M9458_054193, partial [Cirrhinus mrigala]